MARFGAITIPIIATLDKAGFKQAQSAVGKFGRMAVRTMALVGAAAVAAAGKIAMDSINAFSDYQESLSKTQVIFGDSAKSIEEFAKTASSTFGQSAQQALDAASTFATFGKAAGLSGRDLTQFSTGLTTLSSDLASFYNTSPEEAIQAIGSALRGESEPIRRYGVLLDDATLRQKALEMGLIETTKNALTPAQKTLASYQVILDKTTDAQGDFSRTSDGLANSQRTLSAVWQDVQVQLGEALAPTFQRFVEWLKTDGITGLQTFVDVLTGKEVTGTEWTAKNGKIERSFSPVQKSAANLAEAIKKVGENFGKLFDQLEIDDPNGKFWTMVDGLTTMVEAFASLVGAADRAKNSGAFSPFGGWDSFTQGLAQGWEGSWLNQKLNGPVARSQGGVNINVNGTVLDPEGTARAIQRVLTQSQRRAGAY